MELLMLFLVVATKFDPRHPQLCGLDWKRKGKQNKRCVIGRESDLFALSLPGV